MSTEFTSEWERASAVLYDRFGGLTGDPERLAEAVERLDRDDLNRAVILGAFTRQPQANAIAARQPLGVDGSLGRAS